jgi:CO dehydrogenase nickel-insertion accessory protein CooC1
MSNPLKVYLTLLDEGSRDVVVDGVAGVDMINFGLYHACDYLITVVEPSRNSIKVAGQIKKLCETSDVNY